MDVEFWGDKKYAAESSICKAAFHSGSLTKFGGDVIVEVDYGELKYIGADKNGVKS
jgi:hypothetical protein